MSSAEAVNDDAPGNSSQSRHHELKLLRLLARVRAAARIEPSSDASTSAVHGVRHYDGSTWLAERVKRGQPPLNLAAASL